MGEDGHAITALVSPAEAQVLADHALQDARDVLGASVRGGGHDEGEVNQYLSPWSLALHLDPRVSSAVSRAHGGEERLAYTRGPGRFTIRAPGTSRGRAVFTVGGGPTHALCSSVEEGRAVMEVIPGFRPYRDLVLALLRQIPRAAAREGKGRVTLPRRLDALLPKLNLWIREYAEATRGQRSKVGREVRAVILSGLRVEFPCEVSALAWEEVRCSPGDLMTWDTGIPHRLCAVGDAHTPVILHELPLRPVHPGYYGSPLHEMVLDELFTGRIGEGTTRDNVDEVVFLSRRGVLSGILDGYSNLGRRERLLMALERYP